MEVTESYLTTCGNKSVYCTLLYCGGLKINAGGRWSVVGGGGVRCEICCGRVAVTRIHT